MQVKGNKIENWNDSYEHLQTTYSEEFNTPANLVNTLQNEFVYEDIKRYLAGSNEIKVLECGCGGARTSLYLSLRGFDVTCSDYASGAVRLAIDNFAACNAKGTFLQDDLLNSKIPIESFDCVMSFGLLEHFEDLQPILNSITRLVKPGGIQIHCIIPNKLSTETIMNVFLFPLRIIKNIILGNFDKIITRSYRDFPHYENSFSAVHYCNAFESVGNKILRCEAGGILYPFLNLPFGIGDLLTRAFPQILAKLIRKFDRTESHLLHSISPTFYIVARKND